MFITLFLHFTCIGIFLTFSLMYAPFCLKHFSPKSLKLFILVSPCSLMSYSDLPSKLGEPCKFTLLFWQYFVSGSRIEHKNGLKLAFKSQGVTYNSRQVFAYFTYLKTSTSYPTKKNPKNSELKILGKVKHTWEWESKESYFFFFFLRSPHCPDQPSRSLGFLASGTENENPQVLKAKCLKEKKLTL